MNHSTFDSQESLRQAREKFNFEMLLQHLGHAPQSGRFQSMRCPFCHKKSKAGLFTSEGARLFKCHSTSCPTGAKAMDDVGYLAFVNGRLRGEAFADFLKLAGVWKERTDTRTSPGLDGTSPPAAQPAPEPEAAPEQRASFEGDTSSSQPSGFYPLFPDVTVTPGEAPSISNPETDPLPAAPGHPPLPTEPVPTQGASPESEVSLDGEAPSSLTIAGVSDEVGATEALRWFYSRLTLSPADEQLLHDKRGLGTDACVAFGFKSNPRTNVGLLDSMVGMFSTGALIQCGLWQARENNPPAPNRQFFGYGRIGKSKDGKDKEVWGWTHPILIPYFDANGELIHLHPHKGGAKGGHRSLYIPRRAGVKAAESFSNVIITEGEFKAAALAQCLGGSMGVVGMPGIQMANNYAMFEELVEWLLSVKAKRVVVVYDNEEKSDPNLPSYKPDRKKRFDAEIWERILALKVWTRLRIETGVWTLPAQWRDANGKADWDGALAAFVKRGSAS
jgi:hypothetical protein